MEKNIKSIEKIEHIINENYKCSENLKNDSIKRIKEILQKLDSNMMEVRDLKNKNFIIPDYQRAYRWGADQITKLIEDIMENEKKSYFLQPIIYRKNQDGKDVIIDGQQRLTSIYIILKVLENSKSEKVHEPLPHYTIEYETRKESTEYLKDFNIEKANARIDNFHMNLAKETVEKLINDPIFDIDKLVENILNTKFIYHQVNEKDENKIFQQINTGKIALTNGELVKGLLLNRRNGIEKNEWAVIWDEMEKNLHIEDFWCMYNNNLEKYQDTRIDYVLEIVAEMILSEGEFINDKKSKYWIFEVLEDYSKKDGINKLWKKIREHYRILKDWYDNIDIYHLVGYILSNNKKDVNNKNNVKVTDLINIYKEKESKKDFIDALYTIIREDNKKISIKTENIKKEYKEKYSEDIKKIINDSKSISIEDNTSLRIVCENINYNDSTDDIKKILLLFNILTFLKKDKNNEFENENKNRFSFGCFKNEKWDIEHIHAKNDNTKSKKGNLKLLKESINKSDLIELEKIENDYNDEKDDKESKIFDEFYERRLLNDEGEMSDDYIKNSLRNLTLLDNKTNREYKDNVFIIKRHILLEKDKNRLFIPICTRNAFLKYYSKNIKQIACWSDNDGNDYLEELISTIANSPIYIKENKKDE